MIHNSKKNSDGWQNQLYVCFVVTCVYVSERELKQVGKGASSSSTNSFPTILTKSSTFIYLGKKYYSINDIFALLVFPSFSLHAVLSAWFHFRKRFRGIFRWDVLIYHNTDTLKPIWISIICLSIDLLFDKYVTNISLTRCHGENILSGKILLSFSGGTKNTFQ